jgi:hypothetical protein
MNQTGIAASEETVSSCTRTDVFYCYWLRTNQSSTDYAQPGSPDSGEPEFFTLYLFATESDKFGPL